MDYITRTRIFSGVAATGVMFALIGTVTALWKNPFFGRMTPVQGFEIPLLAVLAVLSGVYVVVRRPLCANNAITGAGVLGFLGVACPICNKILFLMFGGEALLAYYEPIRLYLTLASIALALWLVWREIFLGRALATTTA